MTARRVRRPDERAGAEILPLLEYVPALTPRYTRPAHLAPYTSKLERARIEPLRLCISVPPRFEKTETTLHGIAWHLAQDPTLQIVYASYAQRLAEKKSRKARDLARRAGVPIADDASSRADWRTGRADGGVWATGVEGALTGEGADLVIVDDPHKDRASAESAVQRQGIYDWFNDVVMTRLEPNGSCIVIQTRWHEDDLIGRLVGQGWEWINLPALDESGASLCSERFSAEQLLGIREQIGEYAWASLYMGQPRPRGGALFRDVTFYDELPAKYRIGKGLDFAYSARTHADKSAAVVMLESDGRYYVVDVRTAHAKVPDFLRVLAGVDGTYPGPWHWYTSTTEAGLADLATATAGVTIQPERASADKFVRAQGVAAAWNAGKVLLPRKAPWLSDFVTEVCGFTGVADRHDDQVDALASAFVRAGGVFAMRPRRSRELTPHSAEWWALFDTAQRVPPKPPDYAAEERRGLESDLRAARNRRQDESAQWWRRNPLNSGRRGGIPRPPF